MRRLIVSLSVAVGITTAAAADKTVRPHEFPGKRAGRHPQLPGLPEAGTYAHPRGKGGLIREGGSEATEVSIRAALEWLQRHQNPDGSWSCHDFVARCSPFTGPCTNHPKHAQSWADKNGRGWKEHDIGVTALAVLAFTGFGPTHRSGAYPDYVQTLQRAVRFLKNVQIRGTGDPQYDGCFRFARTIPKDKRRETERDEELQWVYDHAIATIALGELLAVTGDGILLKRCVEDAAAFCLRARTDRSGWRYSVKSFVPDTSVTAWMVLALKTIERCRELKLITKLDAADLAQAYTGAFTWLDQVTSRSSGITGYRAPGDEGSRLVELSHVTNGYPFSKKLSAMTAAGVFHRLLHGESRSGKAIKQGVAILMKQPPTWRVRGGASLSTINMYYWHFGSLAMFQYGGGLWREWNKNMQQALLPTQRTRSDVKGGGCADGSWDPLGEWGPAGGRVYATALNALTLQTYYRYPRTKESGRAPSPD